MTIEARTDSGLPQSAGKIQVFALVESPLVIPFHPVGHLGFEQNQASCDVHMVIIVGVVEQHVPSRASMSGPIPKSGSIGIEDAHGKRFPTLSIALETGVEIAVEEEVVVDHHQVVIACSGGQCVAHFAQAPVAGSIDGEDRFDTLRELSGRFAAHQDFELRNLERADRLDFTSQFPGALAVGDNEERPTRFALAPVDLLGRNDR